MTFDALKLEAALSPRPVRYFEEVGSSNDLARAWLRDGAPLGAAVIANAQTKGRGRGGHGWLTPPGTALAVSIVLRPTPEHLTRLSMLGALAVVDLVRELGIEAVGIKWPNDVLVQGRKVSGILAEAEWDEDLLLGAVLGIGINVRVDFQATPLAGSAISLEDAAGRSLDRVELLAVLLDRVSYWYEQLESAAFFEAWRNVLVTLGQSVRIGVLEGLAESVDASGALWLRMADSQVRRIVAGDVEMQV